MIEVAVKSARLNTSLKPHLIYDGGDDVFLNKLEEQGVKIVRHRVSFYDALQAHPTENPLYLQIAHGAFLRTEIPLVETEDDFILYTDCDVMFERDVELDEDRPKFFACAPEFAKEHSGLFNTGVMLMNVQALRQDLHRFTNFIRENLEGFLTFDQCAYRQFYAGEVDQLPLEYNWKPYWGRNDEAVIIHFHGPKPGYAQDLLRDPEAARTMTHGEIFHWNIEGYRHYTPRWAQMWG